MKFDEKTLENQTVQMSDYDPVHWWIQIPCFSFPSGHVLDRKKNNFIPANKSLLNVGVTAVSDVPSCRHFHARVMSNVKCAIRGAEYGVGVFASIRMNVLVFSRRTIPSSNLHRWKNDNKKLNFDQKFNINDVLCVKKLVGRYKFSNNPPLKGTADDNQCACHSSQQL